MLCVAAGAATAGVGAAYAPNLSLAIASICIGALGFKIASVNFLSLPSDFFPATHVGTAFGFSGTGGSAGIVLTNAAIGFVLDATGSYSIVLLGVALLTPAAVAVTFLVAGRIEPVRELVELKEPTDQTKV